MVFLFLGSIRATLIPMIAVPVSLIGTFAVLLALGFSANTISLFAMVLAIGIVVDDAIVVVENVEHVMDETAASRPATPTKIAMGQITAPIIAITLVLLSVFVPVGFIPGITGQLYQQFAVTVSVAMLLSAINALTLSPALCAILLSSGQGSKAAHAAALAAASTPCGTATGSRSPSRPPALSSASSSSAVAVGGVYLFGTADADGLPARGGPGRVLRRGAPAGRLDDRPHDRAATVAGGRDRQGVIPAVADVTTVLGYSLLNGLAQSNSGFMIVLRNRSPSGRIRRRMSSR